MLVHSHSPNCSRKVRLRVSLVPSRMITRWSPPVQGWNSLMQSRFTMADRWISAGPLAPPAKGAVHSAEIEYALGNLPTNKVFAWTPDDYKVSEQLQAYFANFIKTGNPNGPALPAWPAAQQGPGGQLLRVDVNTRAEPDQTRARYLFLEQK